MLTPTRGSLCPRRSFSAFGVESGDLPNPTQQSGRGMAVSTNWQPCAPASLPPNKSPQTFFGYEIQVPITGGWLVDGQVRDAQLQIIIHTLINISRGTGRTTASDFYAVLTLKTILPGGFFCNGTSYGWRVNLFSESRSRRIQDFGLLKLRADGGHRIHGN